MPWTSCSERDMGDFGSSVGNSKGHSVIGSGLLPGALGGTRTPNLLIRSQMLYPLSYERGCVASLRHHGPVLCQLPGSADASGDEFRGGADVGAFALLADEAEVL